MCLSGSLDPCLHMYMFVLFFKILIQLLMVPLCRPIHYLVSFLSFIFILHARCKMSSLCEMYGLTKVCLIGEHR